LLTKVGCAMSELLHDEELQLNSLRGLTSLANRLINCTGSAAELPTLVSLLAHLGVLVREGTVEAEGSELQLLTDLQIAEENLAKIAGAAGVEQLYVQYSADVVRQAVRGGSGSWSASSLPWKVFKLVLVRGGPLVVQQNQMSRSTMLSCLGVARDPALRAEALRQLQELIAHSDSAQWDDQLVAELLLKGLLPNAVWRAGRAAQVVRMAALNGMLELLNLGSEGHRLHWELAVREPTYALLPLLLSALEDDEGTSRLVACRVLEQLLVRLSPQAFAYDQVRGSIPEIIKRLDDARDEVRHAALGVLRALARVIEELKVSSYVEYVTAGLMLYLDDAPLQQDVITTLERYAMADPEAFEKEINKSIARGVAPQICDQLLQVAKAQTHNPCAIPPRESQQ